MSCDFGRAALYTSGELDGLEREAFESHITWCTTCRGHLESLQVVDQQLVCLRQIQPRRDLVRGAFARLDEQPARRFIPLRSLSWAAGIAAGIAIVAAIGFNVAHQRFAPQAELRSLDISRVPTDAALKRQIVALRTRIDNLGSPAMTTSAYPREIGAVAIGIVERYSARRKPERFEFGLKRKLPREGLKARLAALRKRTTKLRNHLLGPGTSTRSHHMFEPRRTV